MHNVNVLSAHTMLSEMVVKAGQIEYLRESLTDQTISMMQASLVDGAKLIDSSLLTMLLSAMVSWMVASVFHQRMETPWHHRSTQDPDVPGYPSAWGVYQRNQDLRVAALSWSYYGWWHIPGDAMNIIIFLFFGEVGSIIYNWFSFRSVCVQLDT